MHIDLQCNTQLWIGTFEAEVGEWLRRLSEGIRTGIDVGAGHGEYTLFLLNKTNALRVYAFEPDALTMSLLRSNVMLNDSRDPSRLVLHASFVGDGHATDEVALDQVSRVAGPCLIKVDVEGHEVAVLKGSSKLLEDFGSRWIIETHSAIAERECLAILHDARFTTKIINQGWWRGMLPERRLLEHNRWLVAWRDSPRQDSNPRNRP